jgi:hypothetical protein
VSFETSERCAFAYALDNRRTSPQKLQTCDSGFYVIPHTRIDQLGGDERRPHRAGWPSCYVRHAFDRRHSLYHAMRISI